MKIDIHKGTPKRSTYCYFMIVLDDRNDAMILVEIGECDRYLAERYGVW